MSRSDELIFLGTTWTALATSSIAQIELIEPFGVNEILLLTMGLLPSLILFLCYGLTRSELARWLGVVLFLALPMAWVSHLAMGAGAYMTSETLTLVSATALSGCCIINFGLTLLDAPADGTSHNLAGSIQPVAVQVQ